MNKKFKLILPLIAILFFTSLAVFYIDFRGTNKSYGESISVLPPVVQSGLNIIPRILGSIIGSSTTNATFNTATTTKICFSGSGTCMVSPSSGGGIALTDLSNTATGLTYNNTTGVTSLTSGYNIPLTASTSNWQTAYGWGNHASAGYLTAAYASSTYSQVLTPTSVKVANYNASVGDLVRANVSTSSFAVTLPSAPTNKSLIRIVLTAVGTGFLEVKCGGTDRFTSATGPTSQYLDLQNANMFLQYNATAGIWDVQSTAAPVNFANNFPGIDASTPIGAQDISIDYTNKILTINPPLGYFNVLIDGLGRTTRYRKTGATSFPAWTDTSGVWYFYFDNTGTAVTTQTPWTTDDFPNIAPVYRINNNATLAAGVSRVVAEYAEYHQNDIPADEHMWEHLQGTQWETGFTIANNALSSGAPNADGRNTVIGLTTGHNVDDNLDYAITNSSAGGLWTQDMGSTSPASLSTTTGGKFNIYTQDAGGLVSFLPVTRFPFPYDATTSIPQYISSTGVRTPISSTNFLTEFIYATQNPRVGEAVKVVTATSQFTTIINARSFNWSDIQSSYPVFGADGEIRPLYRLIFEYRSSYNSGTKYAVLREVQDLRKAQLTNTTASVGSVPASSVTVVATGNISSTNAQSALEELDLKKASNTSPVFTGLVTMGNASSTTFTISGNSYLGTVMSGTWNGTAIADSYISSATNWNTAYTDRLKWDGGNTGLVAATGRTSLGLGTMALEANTGSTTITTLGTIGTGTWSATAITVARGGTGLTSATAGNVLVGSTATVMQATSSMFIMPSGNVGIGTTAPSAKLTVLGDLKVGDSGTEPNSINLNSIAQTGEIYANDTTNTYGNSLVLHEHSLTSGVSVLGVRSNSSTSTHGNVTSGQSLFTLTAGGWYTSSYWQAAVLDMQVEATTTLSTTAMPGRFSFKTSSNSTTTPTEKMVLTSEGLLGIGTSSPIAKLDITGTSGGTIMNIFTSARTKLINMLDTGITTLLGTWDYTSALLKIPNSATLMTNTAGEIGIDTSTSQLRYNNGTATSTIVNYQSPTFSYATSTAWSATTTILLGTAVENETWSAAYCWTDAGSLVVSFNDGTNRMTQVTATSSTSNVVSQTLSTNNTFVAGEKRYVDLGTQATSPTKVTCTIKKTIDIN